MTKVAAWIKRNWLILTGWVGIVTTTGGIATVAHQLGSIHTDATGIGAALLSIGASLITVARLAMKYTIVED